MELDYRNEFKTRAEKAYAELNKKAEESAADYVNSRRLFFKAEGVKEAAAKVYEVFETTPLDTDEATAIAAFRKPVNDLMEAARSNLHVYERHMTPGAANDEIHTASAVYSGYELALYYLYTR